MVRKGGKRRVAGVLESSSKRTGQPIIDYATCPFARTVPVDAVVCADQTLVIIRLSMLLT